MRTTRPRPFDMEERYPFLAAYRRTAVRLHPRPGNPGVTDSSVGGPLLWPADEPWPVCEDTDHDETPYATIADVRRERLLIATRNLEQARGGDGAAHHEAFLALRRSSRARVPEGSGGGFIGVAQLFARDVPDLPRPAGTDLLQVLWCPYTHEREEYLPSVRLVWRDSAAVTTPIEDPSPTVWAGEPGYVPESCVVHPEPVPEYPLAMWAGTPTLDGLEDYDDEWAVTHGWKVGGWGGYCGYTDIDLPECGCGAVTEPLLTVGNGEWSTHDGRWRPVEDDEFTPTLAHPTDWEPVRTHIGRAYMMQIFRCGAGFDCAPTVLMT
ncbi:hypothetical protein LX16_2678 [Stackebrandtia albiflava]|uniref:DUF1963 domain-containing protein n=1 Tax=Stackebrandtia albiflava TaxID=406432 RepID=A0A562V208_9ACTN|nr:hypothetical protein [Stackebrandtia albiflava]TWJ11936.1 hypothetical protein LX16_2678 [Stackebrandtia albiflava]